MSPGAKSNPSRASADAATARHSEPEPKQQTQEDARRSKRPAPDIWKSNRGPGMATCAWHIAQRAMLGELSRILRSFEACDPNLPTPADVQHAQDQLALAKQYPGRERSQPSAKVSELDAIKRPPRPKLLKGLSCGITKKTTPAFDRRREVRVWP